MKTMTSLLKVASKKVESIQEDIAKLQKIMLQMDAREKDLLEKIETEYANAAQESNAVLLTLAGRFSQKSQEEIAEIREARQDAIKIMTEKRELLRQHFAEQKRYEILLERKKLALKKEKEKKQQAELDDIANTRFQPDSADL